MGPKDIGRDSRSLCHIILKEVTGLVGVGGGDKRRLLMVA